MFKHKTNSSHRLSPQFLEESNAQTIKDRGGDTPVDDTTMSSNSSRRGTTKESSSSSSSRHRSSRDRGGDREASSSGRERVSSSSSSSRGVGGSDVGGERQQRASSSSPSGGATSSFRDPSGLGGSERHQQGGGGGGGGGAPSSTQASSSRGSRGGARDRDPSSGHGHREGRAERERERSGAGRPDPPPPPANLPPSSSSGNNRDGRTPSRGGDGGRPPSARPPRSGGGVDAAFAAAISPLGSAAGGISGSSSTFVASPRSDASPRDQDRAPSSHGGGGGRGGNSNGGNNDSSGRGYRRIDDDSVQLDHLPMADLMAYLQLVANNSSNLPLTRRDDPELGRTVSSLTPEEYATKCAAFVPSMVRIVGGQYGKYGSVWDLKTSEEFDVTSNTREPGISHGGATCNALLKAMYDTESEANNIASPQKVTAKDLFDDDDDDETVGTAGYTVDVTLNSFDTLVLNDGYNANTMTWAQLLRKMKPEMQGVGFNQVPAVTSSYKLNLNEPFSLLPPDFKKGVNQKRALLIGCNYRNAPNVELKACHDDVRSVKDFLVNVYGFPESPNAMTVLLDDKKHRHPTHMNITNAFKNLAEKSQPGDAVFVLFTGHGCRVLDSPIDETAESYDEAMIPSDYEITGIIRDTLFFKTLLAPMKKGVMVTCIIDCCNTGIMLDLPYLWTTKKDKGEQLPKMSFNNDFSFVRFLKVVKTLYESSVFTRIGKTVGNELDKQIPIKDDDTVIETVDSLETMPDIEQPASRSSFFGALCSPAVFAQNIINCTLQGPDEYSDDEGVSHTGRLKSMTDDHSSCYSYT